MFALLMLAQAAATPAPPPIILTPVPVTDAASDARCIVVLGFIGSRATGEQAEATKRGINFFLGKLRGRDARVDIAGTITRAAEAARTAGLNARSEAERCGAEIEGAGRALGTLRSTIAPPPAPPAPGATPPPGR